MAALRSLEPDIPIVAAALHREWEMREHPSMESWRRQRARVCAVCGEPHDACLCPMEHENYGGPLDDGSGHDS